MIASIPTPPREPPSSTAVTPLRQRIMQFLVSPTQDRPRLAAAIDAEGGWPAAIRICERWRVLPSLATRLKALRFAVPPAEFGRIRQIAAREFVRTTARLRGGVAVLQAIDDAGIPAAGFKGLAALAWLHPGTLDRTIQDVDVLVRPEDVSHALGVLSARGCRPKLGDMPLEDYLAFVRNSPGAAGNEAISLLSPDGAEIDLHWKLGGFDISRLIGESQAASLLGTTVRVVMPADGLRLTAHHALRNDLVPDEIARDVLDAQGWFRLLKPGPVHASAGSVETALEDAIGALRLILVHLGSEEDSPFQTYRTAASHLAGLYTQQLSDGPINTDLPYLASGQAIRQVLRGLWHDAQNYHTTMHAFEAANGEASLPIRRRLTRLLKSVWQTGPSQWRRLRTLASVKDRVA